MPKISDLIFTHLESSWVAKFGQKSFCPPLKVDYHGYRGGEDIYHFFLNRYPKSTDERSMRYKCNGSSHIHLIVYKQRNGTDMVRIMFKCDMNRYGADRVQIILPSAQHRELEKLVKTDFDQFVEYLIRVWQRCCKLFWAIDFRLAEQDGPFVDQKPDALPQTTDKIFLVESTKNGKQHLTFKFLSEFTEYIGKIQTDQNYVYTSEGLKLIDPNSFHKELAAIYFSNAKDVYKRGRKCGGDEIIHPESISVKKADAAEEIEPGDEKVVVDAWETGGGKVGGEISSVVDAWETGGGKVGGEISSPGGVAPVVVIDTKDLGLEEWDDEAMNVDNVEYETKGGKKKCSRKNKRKAFRKVSKQKRGTKRRKRIKRFNESKLF
jgi:hypothetical protein